MVEKVSDFKMPEKVVTRLLRDALPDNVLVSKDAKNAACRSASIFILQLSITAAEIAQTNKRRTLENQDIIKAVTELGLEEYAPQLVRFGARKYITYISLHSALGRNYFEQMRFQPKKKIDYRSFIEGACTRELQCSRHTWPFSLEQSNFRCNHLYQ